MSLLEEAKSIRRIQPKSEYSKEEIDLIIAYLNGEVTSSQVQRALKLKNQGSVVNYLLQGIRFAYQQGRLKVV
jgi:hypothetical protein